MYTYRLSFCLFLLSLSSVFRFALLPFVFVFRFILYLGAISHNRPSAGLLRRIVSQTVSYAFYVIKLSFMSRVSLTSSLLPLHLLSFLPSSSPLFHPYPHLAPFSSLFLPLFCCVIFATKIRLSSWVSYKLIHVPGYYDGRLQFSLFPNLQLL